MKKYNKKTDSIFVRLFHKFVKIKHKMPLITIPVGIMVCLVMFFSNKLSSAFITHEYLEMLISMILVLNLLAVILNEKKDIMRVSAKKMLLISIIAHIVILIVVSLALGKETFAIYIISLIKSFCYFIMCTGVIASAIMVDFDITDFDKETIKKHLDKMAYMDEEDEHIKDVLNLD